MRRKLILGNWKMHGSLASNAALLERVTAYARSSGDAVGVGVCVPAVFLEQALLQEMDRCVYKVGRSSIISMQHRGQELPVHDIQMGAKIFSSGPIDKLTGAVR
ncbi:triose-phosphate isomerase [Caballeronia novacaledonica]|uniref:triose-phosphate isomerase n=1 Tax=Caballeronia novacaledonica TaxID=1544861 RepID=UPI0023591CCB|nr:triose-phosphate isomerase [Caballeronia novacaledonica]